MYRLVPEPARNQGQGGGRLRGLGRRGARRPAGRLCEWTKLNAAIGKALQIPAIRNQLQRMVFDTAPMSPEQYGKFVADDMAAMTKLANDVAATPGH